MCFQSDIKRSDAPFSDLHRPVHKLLHPKLQAGAKRSHRKKEK